MGRISFHHAAFAARTVPAAATLLGGRGGAPQAEGEGGGGVVVGPWLVVVGCGAWGLRHVAEAAAMGALLGVVDVDVGTHAAARAAAGDERVAVYTSVGQMLDGAGAGLRAVVVATHVAGHAAVVGEVLGAGLDVFVEKPMCGTVAEAEAVAGMARSAGRVVMVGHLLRYGRPHALALELVRAGAVGRVRRVKAVRANFGTVRTGENVLWSLCPHDVSVAMAVCGGGMPRMVRCCGQRVVEESGQEDFVDVEMQYWGGVTVRLEASWMHPVKERRFVIYGDDGSIVVNEAGFDGRPAVEMWKTAVKGAAAGRVDIRKHVSHVRADTFPHAFHALPNKDWSPLRAELEHFRQCCFGERDAPDTDAEEGLRVVRVLDAATTSLRQRGGDWVMLSNGAEGAAAAAAVENNHHTPETDDQVTRFFNDQPGDAFEDDHPTPPVGNDGGDDNDDDDDDIRCHLIQAALLNEDALVFDDAGDTAGGGGQTDLAFHPGRRKSSPPPFHPGRRRQTSPPPFDIRGAGDRDTPPEPARPPPSPPFIHPTAVVDGGAIIGDRTKVWHFVHVDAGARIGAHSSLGQNVYVAPRAVVGDNVRVQNNVSIFDRVTIRDNVFLGPSCVFTNVRRPRAAFPTPADQYEETIVGDGATVGANAVIVCGVTIGANAMIGAGAVVTKDVEPHAMVMGNPARQVAWVGSTGIKLHLVDQTASRQATYICPGTGDAYLEVDGHLLLD